MDLIYIIIVSLICLVVLFFIYEKITSSRAWRIRSTVRTFQKEKLAEQNRIDKFKKDADEIITDENKLLKIIEKIHKGEEVEIPLAAFDFIYRKINSISVVDKNGKIKILNAKSFEEFQKTAINLIHKSEPEIFEEEITPAIGLNKNNKLYEIEKFPDGTLVKKNLQNGDLMMVTPTGKKYHNSFEKFEMTVELSEEEKENKKKKNDNKHNGKDDESKNEKSTPSADAKLEKEVKDLKQKQTIEFHNLNEVVRSIAKQIKDKKLSETPSKINDEIRVDIQQAKNKNIENSELENINISQENKTKILTESDSKSEIVIETKINNEEITDEDKSQINIQSSTQIFEVKNSEITSEINIPKTVIKDANNDLEQNINSNIIKEIW